jgi:hypothetical protein
VHNCPEMLAELQRLQRDAELVAFEAGCEESCEREVDEVEWQGAGCTCILAPDETTRRIVAARWPHNELPG